MSGPCGLRSAIEAALCGSYVVVAEKRTSFTRNNVLHLWPYLIHDLRNLGVKKLYGMFCAGSLDHISELFVRFLWGVCELFVSYLWVVCELSESISWVSLSDSVISVLLYLSGFWGWMIWSWRTRSKNAI